MSVTALYRNLCSGWHALAESIWPSTTEQTTAAEIARFERELSRRLRRLVRLQTRMEHLRARLAALQASLSQVAESIAAPSPLTRHFDLAKSTELLTRRITRTHEKLQRLQARYEKGRDAFEERKHLYRALVSGEIVAELSEPQA